MIIKVTHRTTAHLERLEKFFNSGNWVSLPTEGELSKKNEPGGVWHGATYTEEDRRALEHPFAKLIRKTESQSEIGKFNLTIEISPYILDKGGNRIKVPITFLAGLMQALDFFPADYERENLGLL